MEELTEKEKQYLKRVFKATDVVLNDIKNSDDIIDFDKNDLFNLAEKLNIEYYD